MPRVVAVCVPCQVWVPSVFGALFPTLILVSLLCIRYTGCPHCHVVSEAAAKYEYNGIVFSGEGGSRAVPLP